MKKYGQILKNERIARKISQDKLAKEIGITQAQISYYEKDINIPSIDICEKLADYYGISIDELVGRSWNDSTRIFNDIHHNQNVTINQKSK